MPTPSHLDWLVDTGERLKSADVVEIEVWELQHGDESAKGCDVLGFQFVNNGGINQNDELFVFESKAAMSGNTPVNRLQDAVNDSAKDILREATTLNALKLRFLERAAKRLRR